MRIAVSIGALRKWPKMLPADGPHMLASLVTVGVVGALWGRGILPGAWAALLALVCVAAVLVGLARQAAAERLAARLCGQPGTGSTLFTMLAGIAKRLDALGHRTGNRHPTTGLPTRERLFAEIQEDVVASIQGQQRLLGTIRFTDFDRLAAFDPEAADGALAGLAARIGGALRSDHVAAQVDRDCFAIWFRDTSEPELALAEFRAITFLMMQELSHGDGLLTPAIETGMAICPEDGTDPAQLLMRGIATLARPQIGPGGELLLVRPEPASAAREQFALEQDLAQAIAEEQLAMLFQPVVDLSAGRIIGAEALLRWDHPSLGAISPQRFIPVVEAIGLSDRFGAWVLNTACREARRWQQDGHAGLRVAVNLSARQLLDDALITKIERTLERHGLPPSALELELTETAAMADAARTLRLFAALHAMGISIAIDDFGSGYSSLSYLKNLPFDKLKIDREFVREIEGRRDSRAICKALVELGAGLDLRVLAEGVETQAEVDTLRQLGCHIFQGYFFAQPMRADAFLALLRDPAALPMLGAPIHQQQAQLKDRLIA